LLRSLDGPGRLRAVLTSADRVLAERAARVLSAVAASGGGSEIDAEAERVLAELPAAPAASFRAALTDLRATEWSADDHYVSWDQLSACQESALDLELLDARSRTPLGARLGQLPGKVFRVTQLVECHVHDADRLLNAAAADGWTLIGAGGDEEGPDDELLEAVMYFTGERNPVPGADFVTVENIGEVLSVSVGDEVADWQETPVTAEFESGWRLRDDDASPGESSPGPDYTALFPVTSCEEVHASEDDEDECVVCGSWQLTPRTADVLDTALSVLSDHAHHDTDERGSQTVQGKTDPNWMFFDKLPRLTWGMSADWRRGIAHACEDLLRDLAEGNWPEPRTNAEEIVLHLAIRDAPAYLDMIEDGGFPNHGHLPRHRDDYDWDGCSEVFFQDHDIMLLYSADMDGIEAPDNEINQETGMGDLRPAAWFDPFENVEPRDPGRTFRR
jgi:hypothetical protein